MEGKRMIYGYTRISTKKQNIERQIRNIKKINKKEVYTGTTTERKGFIKLLKIIKKGDVIIFDSVSRMSRNAEEGIKLYKELFEKGIELIFIKEGYINTEVYKKALESDIKLTDTNVDYILRGINKYLMALAEEQIKIAFIQSEKEVEDLKQRTKEGLETARINGKQIGQIKGVKLTTKKSVKAKEEIKKYSKTFEGVLTDEEVIKIIGVSRNSYYKYKKELVFKGGGE